jgi:hypothetical protein
LQIDRQGNVWVVAIDGSDESHWAWYAIGTTPPPPPPPPPPIATLFYAVSGVVDVVGK